MVTRHQVVLNRVVRRRLLWIGGLELAGLTRAQADPWSFVDFTQSGWANREAVVPVGSRNNLT